MQLLRAVNIPVQYTQGAGHATPHFSGEGMYLSHGDDIYAVLMRIRTGGEPIPSHELAISQAQSDAWFGPSVPPLDTWNNVGRRVRELAVDYLPDALLNWRCQDIQSGATHAESLVYKSSGLILNYSVEELDALTLWERLDVKIAKLGGCTMIP
jgi:hypothetical protein